MALGSSNFCKLLANFGEGESITTFTFHIQTNFRQFPCKLTTRAVSWSNFHLSTFHFILPRGGPFFSARLKKLSALVIFGYRWFPDVETKQSTYSDSQKERLWEYLGLIHVFHINSGHLIFGGSELRLVRMLFFSRVDQNRKSIERGVGRPSGETMRIKMNALNTQYHGRLLEEWRSLGLQSKPRIRKYGSIVQLAGTRHTARICNSKDNTKYIKISSY